MTDTQLLIGIMQNDDHAWRFICRNMKSGFASIIGQAFSFGNISNENNYGMKISDLRLGIFHPSYNKPYVLRMPYLEKEINDIFGLRSEVLF